VSQATGRDASLGRCFVYITPGGGLRADP